MGAGAPTGKAQPPYVPAQVSVTGEEQLTFTPDSEEAPNFIPVPLPGPADEGILGGIREYVIPDKEGPEEFQPMPEDEGKLPSSMWGEWQAYTIPDPESSVLLDETGKPKLPEFTSPPPLVPVDLFSSAHEGFGDATFYRQNRYHRVLRGWDAREPGRLKIGDYISATPSASAFSRPPIFATGWRETNDKYPTTYFVVDGFIRRISFNVFAAVVTLAQVATDACMHDDGSGVPFLYVAEGSAGNIQKMSKAEGLTTAGGTLLRDKLCSVGGSLYGSTQRTGTSRWNSVSLCPFGADPIDSSNWSATSVLVGFPHTDINSIKSVRGIPVILKPEGIFVYNRSVDLWENMIPAWEYYPHPDNGRGTISLGAYLVVPLGDGGCVIFDGYNIKDFSPLAPPARPNIDTTPQHISCMTALPGNQVAAVTQVCRTEHGGQGSRSAHGWAGGATYSPKTTERGGSDDDGSAIKGTRVFKTVDNEANFTDYTANASDGNMASTVVLSALATAADGDYFYVGHPRPFGGVLVEFDATTATVNTNTATLTAEYWNGTTWVSLTIRDFTGVGAITLGQGGIIFIQDIFANSGGFPWTTRVLGADSQSNYYIRFSVSATLSATVTPTRVALIPWRPPIDYTNFPIDGRDRSGHFAHLLIGSIDTGVWHDMGALYTGTGTTDTANDEFGVLLQAHMGGLYGNGPRKLTAIGRTSTTFFEGGGDRWPFVSQSGLIEFPLTEIANGQRARLRTLDIIGENFEGFTNIFFYYRYDPHARWSRIALGSRLPVSVIIPGFGVGGTHFQWALGHICTLDTIAERPAVTSVRAGFEPLAGNLNTSPSKPPTAVPRG